MVSKTMPSAPRSDLHIFIALRFLIVHLLQFDLSWIIWCWWCFAFNIKCTKIIRNQLKEHPNAILVLYLLLLWLQCQANKNQVNSILLARCSASWPNKRPKRTGVPCNLGVKLTMELKQHMEVSWNRASSDSSYHPFFRRIFHEINHPAMGVPPWLWKPPYVSPQSNSQC